MSDPNVSSEIATLDPDLIRIDSEALSCLPEHLLRRFQVLPLLVGEGRVVVGMADP
jgi:hypothetical protein